MVFAYFRIFMYNGHDFHLKLLLGKSQKCLHAIHFTLANSVLENHGSPIMVAAGLLGL